MGRRQAGNRDARTRAGHIVEPDRVAESDGREEVWAPERRYSVADLVTGLQLEMAQAGRPRRPASGAREAPPDEGKAV